MNNLNDIALRLAQITGKPITDFIKDEGANHGTSENREQTQKEYMEDESQTNKKETLPNIREIRDKEDPKVDRSWDTECTKIEELLKLYGGEIINGKLLNTTQRMSRKEYLAEKKKFKTLDEFWQSPLLYLMFRAEEQAESNFVNWSTSIEMDIIKNEKKK